MTGTLGSKNSLPGIMTRDWKAWGQRSGLLRGRKSSQKFRISVSPSPLNSSISLCPSQHPSANSSLCALAHPRGPRLGCKCGSISRLDHSCRRSGDPGVHVPKSPTFLSCQESPAECWALSSFLWPLEGLGWCTSLDIWGALQLPNLLSVLID